MKKQEHNSTDKRTRTEAVGSYLWIAGTRTLGIAACFSTICKHGPLFANGSRVSSAWDMVGGSDNSCFGSGPL